MTVGLLMLASCAQSSWLASAASKLGRLSVSDFHILRSSKHTGSKHVRQRFVYCKRGCHSLSIKSLSIIFRPSSSLSSGHPIFLDETPSYFFLTTEAQPQIFTTRPSRLLPENSTHVRTQKSCNYSSCSHRGT